MNATIVRPEAGAVPNFVINFNSAVVGNQCGHDVLILPVQDYIPVGGGEEVSTVCTACYVADFSNFYYPAGTATITGPSVAIFTYCDANQLVLTIFNNGVSEEDAGVTLAFKPRSFASITAAAVAAARKAPK